MGAMKRLIGDVRELMKDEPGIHPNSVKETEVARVTNDALALHLDGLAKGDAIRKAIREWKTSKLKELQDAQG